MDTGLFGVVDEPGGDAESVSRFIRPEGGLSIFPSEGRGAAFPQEAQPGVGLL